MIRMGVLLSPNSPVTGKLPRRILSGPVLSKDAPLLYRAPHKNSLEKAPSQAFVASVLDYLHWNKKEAELQSKDQPMRDWGGRRRSVG